MDRHRTDRRWGGGSFGTAVISEEGAEADFREATEEEICPTVGDDACAPARRWLETRRAYFKVGNLGGRGITSFSF